MFSPTSAFDAIRRPSSFTFGIITSLALAIAGFVPDSFSAQVTLSWTDNASNETGNNIERATGTGSYSQVATTAANVVSYTDTTVAASTSYNYRIRAYNSAGNSGYSNVASVTTGGVPPTNTAPVIGSITNRTINEDGTTGAIAVTVSDAETSAGSLQFSATSSSTALVPNANITLGGSGGNRTITVTPATNQNGIVTITATVSDGALAATRAFTVTVTAVNDTPTISGIADRTINVGGNSGAIAFTVGDVETAAASLTLTRASSNTTLVATSGIVLGGSGANRTVTVTPVSGQSGSATITVTASDGSLSASDAFVLTVNATGANTAPTISSIANRTVNVGASTGAIAFTVGDVETAAGSLTLTGTSSNATLVASSAIVFGGSGANRTVTITPAPGQTGTATITVTVSDGTATASSSFALTATAGQMAGLVAAYGFNEGTGTTVSDASGNGISGTLNTATWTTGGKYGSALSFNGSNSYIDLGNPAALQITGSMTWSAWVKAAANPADDGQIIAKSDDASGWQFKTSPDTGSHTFGAGVSGALNSRTQRYSTIVRSLSTWYHVAGVYDAAARTLDVYVNGVRDNGTLIGTIPASQINSTVNVNIGRRTGGFYFNGIIDEVRIYNRALSATEVLTDMNTPVNAASNTPPTISDVANQTLNEDTATAALPFTVGDSQTAAGSLTVTRTSSNVALVPTANIVVGGSGANRTVTITPAANQTGTATITLIVSDGVSTASDTLLVTVNAVNDAPTISDIANQSTTASTAVGPISFTVGDIDTALTSLTTTRTSSNTTLVPAANIVFGGSGANRTVTMTPASGQTGTATITVTVSDGSLSASDTFVLTVNATGANTAPTISSIANQSIATGGTTGPISFTIGDAQTAAGSLTLSGSSSNTTLVPTAGITFGGSGANRTVTVVPAATQSGTATITVQVSDGAASSSRAFTLTVTAASQVLTSSDIGAPALAGSMSSTNGTIQIRAAGADIWGRTDQFHFARQSLQGDAEMTVRVASLQNTNGWAKAGLMFRGSLAANAPHVSVFVTPSNGVVLQWRPQSGANSQSSPALSGAAPEWLRLVRTEDSFYAFSSENGLDWTLVEFVQVDLPDIAYGGPAVTSHNAQSITTATFDSFAVD